MSGSCRRARVCDLRSLPDFRALRAWATKHKAAVAYLGPDHQGHAVYGAATAAGVQRVAVIDDEPDTHRWPSLKWTAPTERLPRIRAARP